MNHEMSLRTIQDWCVYFKESAANNEAFSAYGKNDSI